jgi:hypothetical protein
MKRKLTELGLLFLSPDDPPAEKERDAALARAAKLERNEKLREIGKKHNLSDDLSLRLVGETDEELDEDAKRLAKLVKTADEKKKAPETDAGKKDKAGAGAPKSSENGKAPVQRYQGAYDVPWPD